MTSILSRTIARAALLLTVFSTTTVAYRPVQFVKHFGDNGHADQEFSLTQFYNESTQQSDLYIRMGSFRYNSDAKGWAAFGIGPWMTGALMFMTYGDPAADAPMTFSVRTADGHHPPRPLEEMSDFYNGTIPEVDLIKSQFVPYAGEYYSNALKQKPSHLGLAEFIVRGYDRWTGVAVKNNSIGQEFIWSSNFKQVFEHGDYSPSRAIDMHQFGLGFGFLWIDLLNAVVPKPGFGPIKDMEGHKGLSEIQAPEPPTAEELAVGAAIMAGPAPPSNGATAAADATTATTPPVVPIPANTAAPDTTHPGGSSTTPGADHGSQLEQPVKSAKQWNIRSLMWHIHGFLMLMAFMFFYPLAIYMLRSPRATAFQLHWTLNSLGSICVAVSAGIGYVNSHAIHITHQYLGIAIVVALAVQLLLGWRHHVNYLANKRAAWMTETHIWLGRTILPMGMLNLIFGLMLRRYGWFIVGLTVLVMLVQLIALAFVLRKARGRTPALQGLVGEDSKGLIPATGADAEEYFQLTGDDDDDDGFSSDGERDVEARRTQEEKLEQSRKLAKLDKV